jgi:adenylate kinase
MAHKQALILLGAPGAGKGTQAKRIAKNFGVPHLSTGDMFRDAVARGTETGRLAKPVMESGGLVPDDIVMKIVEERLAQPDCAAGFVLDGFPRTLPQAEQLDRMFERGGFLKPVVVDIEVSPETLVRRLSGRWTCSTGGEIYNVYDAPPKVPGICDADGGALVQRSDDRPEVVKARLEAYERQTRPLAEYYRRQGLLNVVKGEGGAEDVSRSIGRILEHAGWRDGHL